MSTFAQIVDILTKEKENNLQRQGQYRKEIVELPKGKIVTRKHGKREYYSLNYYCDENKKGVFKYIGKDKAVALDIQKQAEKRKHLEKSLRDLEEDLETIEKILKITNKRLQQESVRDKLEEMGANQDTSTVQQPQIQAIDMQNINKRGLIEQRERERK